MSRYEDKNKLSTAKTNSRKSRFAYFSFVEDDVGAAEGEGGREGEGEGDGDGEGRGDGGGDCDGDGEGEGVE